MRLFWSFAIFIVTALATPAVQAQTPEEAAAAEALFREARTLYNAGRVTEACPKFEASYKAAAGLGTLLNLARCYDKDGKIASAWARYVDLESLAIRAGQNDRAAIAKKAIVKLEPQLTKVRIQVSANAAAATLEVRRDNIIVSPAAYGVPLALDPGTHRITASAEGYQSWSHDFTIPSTGGEGKVIQLTIPALQPVAAAPQPAVPPPAPSKPTPSLAPEPIAPPDSDADGNMALYLGGGATLGIGLVALGVGAGFAANAASLWDDAGCSNGVCPTSEAQQLSESANRDADVATVLVVGGGAVAAAGVAILIAAVVGDTSSEKVGWSLTPTGARLRF